MVSPHLIQVKTYAHNLSRLIYVFWKKETGINIILKKNNILFLFLNTSRRVFSGNYEFPSKG